MQLKPNFHLTKPQSCAPWVFVESLYGLLDALIGVLTLGKVYSEFRPNWIFSDRANELEKRCKEMDNEL